MSQLAVTSLILVVTMVLFIWNKWPAAVVAIGSALALFFTGVLNIRQALEGFGDPLVVFIGALLVVGFGLETTGVGTWAGQLLIRHAGTSPTRLLVALMVLSALFTAVIGMNGAVVTMLPIAVVIAVRTGIAPSKLMMPISIACLTAANLTLLGTPVNVIAMEAGQNAGARQIGFFEWSFVGIPLFVGSVAIVLAFGRFLLPDRRSSSLPANLSEHGRTLLEHYKLNPGAADSLLNSSTGLAEIVIPARSTLVGQTASAGTTTDKGNLTILAVQRGGDDVGKNATQLRAGDHLLLSGTWEALDKRLADPDMLVVDAPEAVRRQAVGLGRGSFRAIGILITLIVLLTFNVTPPAIAALLCAGLMVVFGVVTLNQVYRGIDWNTPILIAGLIPLATAMTQTGLAGLIGDTMIKFVGSAGSHAVLAGLFLVTAVLTQVISNASSALVMAPIAVATAGELSISPLPLLIAVTLGAGSAHLTPMSTPVNLVTYGPGAYEFRDYWKLGLLIVVWALLVAVFITPLHWKL